MPFESDTSEDMVAELSVIIQRLPDHEVRQGAPEMRVGPCSCTQHMPLAGMRTHESTPTHYSSRRCSVLRRRRKDCGVPLDTLSVLAARAEAVGGAALVQTHGRISARPPDGATAGLALSGSALSTAAGGGTGGTGGVVAAGGRLSETAELDGGDAIHIFSLSRTRSGVCVVSCVYSRQCRIHYRACVLLVK